MRRPDIKLGSKVFCRFHAGPLFLPGSVNQQNGEKILVVYEDGEKEWTTISMVRVQRPLAKVGEPPAQPHQGQGPGEPGMPLSPDLPGGMMPGGFGNVGPMTGTMTATGPMMMPPPGPFIPDVGDPVEDSNWRVGDRALGRWLDFYWYPATILAIGTKGYHLLFDDGDQRVVPDLWIMPIDLEEGDEVFIRAKDQPQLIFTPARIVNVRGEILNVDLEDGTHETNQSLSRARFWRCPVGVRSRSFDETDRVWAQDIDGFSYPAEILSIDGDKIIVHFLDGPERMLTPELIRPFDLQSGACVECRWKGGPRYFPGQITQKEGDRIHFHYADGDKEWTTLRLVRTPPKRVAEKK